MATKRFSTRTASVAVAAMGLLLLPAPALAAKRTPVVLFPG